MVDNVASTLGSAAGNISSNASSALDAIDKEKNPSDSRAGAARTKLAQDFDTFLLLLTTQLKHQDPTEPLDTNQLTSQIAELAQVEQGIAANENLEKLVEFGSHNGVDAGIGYIDKVIEAKGNSGFLVGGTAPFVYTLPAAASKVDIVITNNDGEAVFSGQGNTEKGKNLVTWSGVNSFTSQQMPSGEYHITVKAVDATGEEMEAVTSTTGIVTAVELVEGRVTLNVGTLAVPLEDVKAVSSIPPEPEEQAAAQ